ncbi:secreted protein [Candidatus Omnitrophus magneticus]|uniref:Secreted protein n=1 Tax=Candidatus Omnitrophus magneticus TaxID=1609969 RepID=A0A0F0CKW2_9BACT|nr:secreted protein [Candidatus Omnitrophus magneticus]
MRKMLAVVVMFGMVLLASGIVLAADIPQAKACGCPVEKTCDCAKKECVNTSTGECKRVKSSSGPIQKLERGAGNVLFGWTEIPKRVVDKNKESNPIKGSLLGLFQGTCKAFARTASGFADVATFPFGGYDNPKVMPDMPAAK